jgi:hypothetical protein
MSARGIIAGLKRGLFIGAMLLLGSRLGGS